MAIERIEINLSNQILTATLPDCLKEYPCSTAKNGPGENEGSYCTPRGKHRIRAVIGIGANPLSIFMGRRRTGELWSPELHSRAPDRDWILGRILWLCGEEVGVNRGGSVDTQRRYIYIHGTPPTEVMGKPQSLGCVRMRINDVCELAAVVKSGCPVNILEQ